MLLRTCRFPRTQVTREVADFQYYYYSKIRPSPVSTGKKADNIRKYTNSGKKDNYYRLRV